MIFIERSFSWYVYVDKEKSSLLHVPSPMSSGQHSLKGEDKIGDGIRMGWDEIKAWLPTMVSGALEDNKKTINEGNERWSVIKVVHMGYMKGWWYIPLWGT